MRIAINTRFLLPNKMEGIGWFTHEVVRRIVLGNPSVEFVFLFDRKYDPRFLFAENVTPWVVYPPARHPLLWYAWFEWSIPRALSKLNVDLFFSPDGYCSLSTNTKTVMVSHDLAYLHYPQYIPGSVLKYYLKYVPKFHKKADHILTVSNYTKQDVINQYGIDASKISVTCNGCREEVFKPISKEKQSEIRRKYTHGKPYFLFVGAIHPRKNVLGLIEAFEKFKSETTSDHSLFLVGRYAWQTDEVRNKIEQSTWRADIIRPGHVGDELSSITASAEALILPSFFEGFGVPLLEAMYCDVPVITSDRSSLPEVAGKAGCIINPDDSDSIMQAMLKLSTDNRYRESLVLAGQSQRSKYTWDKAAAKVWEAVESNI